MTDQPPAVIIQMIANGHLPYNCPKKCQKKKSPPKVSLRVFTNSPSHFLGLGIPGLVAGVSEYLPLSLMVLYPADV